MAGEQTGGGKIDLSRVVSRAAEAVRANPGVYLALTLIVGGPPCFVSGWWQFALRRAAITDYPGRDTSYYLSGDFWLQVLAIWGIGLISDSVLRAALTRATATHLSGGRPDVTRCLETGLVMIIPITALSLIVWIGSAIALLVLLVPGVILWLCWSMAIPARVQERIGVIDALRRSAALTRGNRWNIFLVVAASSIGLGLAGWAMRSLLGLLTVTSQPIFALVETAIGMASSMIIATIEASIYVELRHIKDGAVPGELVEIFA